MENKVCALFFESQAATIVPTPVLSNYLMNSIMVSEMWKYELSTKKKKKKKKEISNSTSSILQKKDSLNFGNLSHQRDNVKVRENSSGLLSVWVKYNSPTFSCPHLASIPGSTTKTQQFESQSLLPQTSQPGKSRDMRALGALGNDMCHLVSFHTN